MPRLAHQLQQGLGSCPPPWFWKLLKSKTQNFAPLHHVFVRVRPGSLNCCSDAWTEIFLLYPLTGASIAHKLLVHCLQKCLAFKDDSPAVCTEYIALINTSVSQLGHMKDMSVRDVFALVTLCAGSRTGSPARRAIPIGLTRIRRPLRNTSSFGTIVACRRKPVAMPLCLSATTWSEQVLFEAGCTDYQDGRIPSSCSSCREPHAHGL